MQLSQNKEPEKLNCQNFKNERDLWCITSTDLGDLALFNNVMLSLAKFRSNSDTKVLLQTHAPAGG